MASKEQDGAGERIIIDDRLVKRLITSQFPKWKDQPIRMVDEGGWDNITFHLGEEMSVRLPRGAEYELQVEKEQRWLPKLSPPLPLAIPAPLAMGKPGEGYPWKWSIYKWLDGKCAAAAPIADLCRFAHDLAQFLVCLRKINTSAGPPPGLHSFHRGSSLKIYDEDTKRALDLLKGEIDTTLAAQLWHEALETEWKDPPVWLHGDISAGNLLVKEGELFAVIDFGQMAVGDPACDLAIAWTMFSGPSREFFRKQQHIDPQTWARGRAWALWKALIVAAGFTSPNNAESRECWRIINEVLVDYKHDLQK